MRPANHGDAYELLPTADGTEVQLDCLGSTSSAILITALEQMERALAALLAHGVDGDLFIDGEFDEVPDGRGGYVMRMAVLSLYAPRAGARTILLHFPSLFAPFETALGQYDVPEGARGLAALADVMRTPSVRRVWWGGNASDASALLFALPCLAPLTPVRDLQLEVRAHVQAGVLPPGTPFSLAGICAHALNARLDKSLQRANWSALPSGKMIAYAAGDVLVLERLALALDSGELAVALLAAAPLLLANLARVGAERREEGDFVSGLQDYVSARNASVVVYTDRGCDGPPHAREFTAAVSAHGLGQLLGRGPSKKAAKQAAARAACLAWIPGAAAGMQLTSSDVVPPAKPPASLQPLPHAAAVARATPRPNSDRASSGDEGDDDGAPWRPRGPGAALCLAANFVGGLNEWSQQTPGARATFEPVTASGPPHRPHFDARVVVAFVDQAGVGQLLPFAGESDVNAKAAKQAAARAACVAVMASGRERRVKARCQ